jgi:hypothetical protein
MKKQLLVIAALLALLLLLAIRRPGDASVRFIKKQNQIASPHTGATTR